MTNKQIAFDVELRTNFKKIKASLTHGLIPFKVTNEGIKFNQPFVERLYQVEEMLRSYLIIPINEQIGLHNWAIDFIEEPTEEPKFLVDIYVDNEIDYKRIARIIDSINTDIKFSYWYKGNTQDYLKD